jgi:nucleoside phosphorylase
MNWLAILCAGAAYWVLGFVWYSLLFGKIWAEALRGYRAQWPDPAKGEMAGKLVGTFVSNVITAGAIAYILYHAAPPDIGSALRLGIAAGVGLAGAALTIAHIWESKPTRVWMIDVSYHFVGCIVTTLILFSWH